MRNSTAIMTCAKKEWFVRVVAICRRKYLQSSAKSFYRGGVTAVQDWPSYLFHHLRHHGTLSRRFGNLEVHLTSPCEAHQYDLPMKSWWKIVQRFCGIRRKSPILQWKACPMTQILHLPMVWLLIPTALFRMVITVGHPLTEWFLPYPPCNPW